MSETNHHTTKFFTENLFAIETLLSKPLWLSTLELSKISMWALIWLCNIKTWWKSGFNVCIKTYDIYKDIAEDIETRFDTSIYDLDRPLPKVKNERVIGLMKDVLGGKAMTNSVGLGAKTYRYLIDDDSEDIKAKQTNNCVIRKR